MPHRGPEASQRMLLAMFDRLMATVLSAPDASTWIAVGITSLDDWPMLTASLGWTGVLPPRTPLLNRSLATPAITSLVFMLVEVPLPVWKISTTNWSSC